MNDPQCPICNGSMTERKGKFGTFFGCDNYPRCKGTAKASKSSYSRSKVSLSSFTKVKPVQELLLNGSPEQNIIWDELLNGYTHIQVDAVAGSGKSTTLVQGLLRIHAAGKQLKAGIVAFNKHIEREMNDKLTAAGLNWVRAMTYHSLGNKACRTAFGRVNIDSDKLDTIVGMFLNPETEPGMIAPVKKLVSLCKNYLLTGTDRMELQELALKHDVDVPDMLRAADIIPKVLAKCLETRDTIDFDDMLWIPVMLKLPVEQFDMLMVDEYQDTNKVQQELKMMACPHGRIVVVGDTYQAIYGFRGADSNAMPNGFDMLNATKRGCIKLPLTVTRRCPKSHVTLAQAIVPHIKAMDNAPDGTIENMETNRAIESMRVGDLVLCRVNKHLIPVAYQLIRRNIPAKIRGRDIGQGLVSLIIKLRAVSIVDLSDKLRMYREREETRLMALGRKGASQLMAMQDRCDTISELCEGVASVSELKAKIESLFADFEADGGEKQFVILGTVHRTKGLEASTVYVLAPELIPHPMASQEWEYQQEANLAYVAATRSTNKLVFVGQIPPIYSGGYEPETGGDMCMGGSY